MSGFSTLTTDCWNLCVFSELVWKVARYTSAAPMFFKECDNYVDGGVLANNPCDYGLTAIQNFYRRRGEQLPIALVVSVGTGIYPAEELGRIDAHEFLFFGKHWFNASDTLRKRAQNLISLISSAVSNSTVCSEHSLGCSTPLCTTTLTPGPPSAALAVASHCVLQP